MTTLEAPKAIWVRLLRDLDDLSFQPIPRPLTSAAMDALPRLEEVQSSVQRTTKHLLERHAATTEGGEMVVVDGDDRSEYDPAALVRIGDQQVLLDAPEVFRSDRQDTLQETAALDVRLLSIADLDAPLGRLRKSPLRVFVEELVPEAVTVSE